MIDDQPRVGNWERKIRDILDLGFDGVMQDFGGGPVVTAPSTATSATTALSPMTTSGVGVVTTSPATPVTVRPRFTA